MSNIKEIYQIILKGEWANIQDSIKNALEAGIVADTILSQGMIDAMQEVGRLFEEGDYFIPEMLISAKTMQSGLEILKPHLVDSGVEPRGKVIIGTVKGDLHDIGKNLVAMMLEGGGYEVIDMGVDVSPDAFVDAVKKGADVVGLSALLTTTIPSMEKTIKAFEEAGVRDKIKVIVGGAPVTEEFAKKIGADGYADDASHATSLVKRLMEG